MSPLDSCKIGRIIRYVVQDVILMTLWNFEALLDWQYTYIGEKYLQYHSPLAVYRDVGLLSSIKKAVVASLWIVVVLKTEEKPSIISVSSIVILLYLCLWIIVESGGGVVVEARGWVVRVRGRKVRGFLSSGCHGTRRGRHSRNGRWRCCVRDNVCIVEFSVQREKRKIF